MDKIKKKLSCLLLCLLTITSGLGIADTQYQLNLEVVSSTGDFDQLTPMLIETTSSNDVRANINATNINSTNPFGYLQYLRLLLNWSILETLSIGETVELTYLLEIEFEGSTTITLNHTLQMVEYSGQNLYVCYMEFWVNSTREVYETEDGPSDSLMPEFHIWRSKSNQIYFQWALGNSADRDILAVLPSWNVVNFTYSVFNNPDEDMCDFRFLYMDLGIQNGNNEGIQDPISNDNWGFFEPLRQVLMFVINLFLDLVRVVIPDSIEEMFDAFYDELGTYIDPLMALAGFITDNFLNLITLVHIFLIVNGVYAATEGDLANVVTPLWRFYSGIFHFVFAILGFVLSVIRTIISAVPFI